MVHNISSDDSQKGKICPACGFENIQGVDVCVECFTDLFHLDAKAKPTTDNQLEKALLRDHIFELDMKKAFLVKPDTTVEEAIELLVEGRRGALFVVEDLDKSGRIDDPNEIIGIFRAWEAQNNVFIKDPIPLDEPIRDYMSRNDIILDINDHVAEAIHELQIRKKEYLPVFQEGMAIRYIGIKDIMDYIMKKNPQLEDMQFKGEEKFLKKEKRR
jgi:CBS domain-containing protein